MYQLVSRPRPRRTALAYVDRFPRARARKKIRAESRRIANSSTHGRQELTGAVLHLRLRSPVSRRDEAAKAQRVNLVRSSADETRRRPSGAFALIADPQTGVAPGWPEAAMCVQGINVQCVLQFTLIHAASCALHRLTSRVIHRSK